MPISVIQFNGSNAYEFQPGEFITSREFGILNMDDLALGVEVYTANTTSRLKATMRFIDEHGVLLSTSSSTYTPTVQNLWERALFTWSVPDGATRAELRMEGVTSVILMAQPKVANGTDPGSYGSNWSPQLTFLTPTGIYTGTLSAKQIILSAGEDLSDRLVTINANHLLLLNRIKDEEDRVTSIEAGVVKLGTVYNGVEIDQTKGLEINSTIDGKAIKVRLNATEGLAYYQGNAFKGGLRLINGEVALMASYLSRNGSTTRFALAGELATGGGGFSYYNKTIQSGFIFAISEFVGGGFALVDRYDRQRISVAPNGFSLQLGSQGVGITDYNGQTRLDIPGNGGIVIRDSADKIRINILTNGEEIVAPSGQQVFYRSGNNTQLYCATNNGHSFGVDSSGPYYVRSGIKKYLT